MTDTGKYTSEEALTAALEACGGTQRADLLFQRGRLRWQEGRRAAAMTDYAEAAELDPASPAVQALDQAREIMSFFNKDLYNP